jgi:hypothetical protein
MARRTAFILFGALLLAAVVVVAALLLRNDEPQYKGRNLVYWMKANSKAPNDPDIRKAIATITTNYVHVLVRWLCQDTSPEERMEAKLPDFVRGFSLVHRFTYRNRRHMACSWGAFKIAGTNAVCAIPALTEVLSSTNNTTAKVQAMLALQFIGPAALPAIRQAMTNRDALVRGLAVENLRIMGTNAVTAVPDLIAALYDPDADFRLSVTNALREIAPEVLSGPPVK